MRVRKIICVREKNWVKIPAISTKCIQTKRDSEIERDFASLLAFHIPSIEIRINQLKEASHAIMRLSFALDFVLQLLNLLQNTATHGQPRVKASVADAGAVRRACVRACRGIRDQPTPTERGTTHHSLAHTDGIDIRTKELVICNLDHLDQTTHHWRAPNAGITSE